METAYFEILLLTVTTGPLLFGYHLVSISVGRTIFPLLTLLQGELNAPSEVITCAKKSLRITDLALPQCIPMTPAEFGLVQSIFTLGGLIGALSAGPVSSKRGRLFAMRLNTVPVILGPFIAAFAPSVALMSLGRLVSGVGAGASLVIVPIYISEISPVKSRGFYGAFTQIMINAGIFIAQAIGYFLSHDSAWRIILGVAGVIGIVQALSLAMAVESPKWLGTRHRWSEARSSLARLRHSEDNIDEEIKSWRAHDGRGESHSLPCTSTLTD